MFFHVVLRLLHVTIKSLSYFFACCFALFSSWFMILFSCFFMLFCIRPILKLFPCCFGLLHVILIFSFMLTHVVLMFGLRSLHVILVFSYAIVMLLYIVLRLFEIWVISKCYRPIQVDEYSCRRYSPSVLLLILKCDVVKCIGNIFQFFVF